MDAPWSIHNPCPGLPPALRVPVLRFSSRIAVWLAGVMLSLATVRAETPVRPPSFLNDVMPLFTRLGCNQGACHGKGSGQNGFRLSLRGYAPDWDHDWITREFDGRRINLAVPQASSLLLKPTGQAPHEGGKLFDVDSRAYK